MSVSCNFTNFSTVKFPKKYVKTYDSNTFDLNHDKPLLKTEKNLFNPFDFIFIVDLYTRLTPHDKFNLVERHT